MLAAIFLFFWLSGCIIDFSGLTSETGEGGGSPTTSTDPNAGTCKPLECGSCQSNCTDQTCPSVTLVTGAPWVSGPTGIAVTSNALYWINRLDGSVGRLLNDGSPAELIVQGANEPRGIAAGETHVAWAEKSGLWVCPADDCQAQKKQIAPSLADATLREVVLDGTRIFWADAGTSPTDGKVYTCEIETCTPFVLAENLWAPVGIAVLDNKVFFTTAGDEFPNGRLYRVETSGGTKVEITAGVIQPSGIAVDDLRVYYSEYTLSGKVQYCLHSSPEYCNEGTLVAPSVTTFTFPRDVAVAAGRVYFSATDQDGSIYSCAAPACTQDESPKVHTSERPSLRRMAVGASCVFFTDESNGGSIVKAAR